MDMRRLSISKEVLCRRYSHDPSHCSSGASSSVDNDELIALVRANSEDGVIDEPTRYGSGSITGEGKNGSRQQSKRLSIAQKKELLKDEMTSMAHLALPVVATSLMETFPSIVVAILVGRADYGDGISVDGDGTTSKSALYMTSASLASMFVNIVAFSTGLGLLGAMDTLCSTAHGAGQPSKMGTYLLTGTAVLSVLTLLVSWIIFQAENIFLWLDQPPLVCRHAALFALWYLPGIPFVYAYELLRKISEARGEVYPMMLAALIENVVVAGVGYYLVNYSDWGWLGAAWAVSLGRIASLPCIVIGMTWCGDKMVGDDDLEEDYQHLFRKLWEGFRPSQALNAKAIILWLGLGIPGMLQMMFEWIAWEVITLLCGILPGEKRAIIAIGSSAIGMSVSNLTFMAYYGTCVAGNIRIGNALGAGDAHRAGLASYLTMSLGGCLSIINMLIIFCFRNQLPYLFNKDEDMVAKSQQLLIIAAIYQFPDAINCVGQGVFQASGRQALGAKLNFAAYYVLGIPLAYLLGNVMDFGVEGLWWGMTVGLFFIATANAVVVLKSDWKALSLEARKRLSLKPVPGNEA